jgi:transposase
MLFGKKTALPLYTNIFNGSINDVTLFPKCVKQYDLVSEKNIKYVLNHGMYSKKNIYFLLDNSKKFIISLPSTTNLKYDLIELSQHIYMNPKYTVYAPHSNLYGTTYHIKWDEKRHLWAHVYIDVNQRTADHNKLQDKIFEMYNKIKDGPIKFENMNEYLHFFTLRRRKNTNDEFIAKFKEDALQDILAIESWFIFLTNEIKDATEALRIYRQRDMVEKAFDILKNRTQEENTVVHSSPSYSNKLFIGFLSLLLNSQIHKTMTENNMKKKFTITELYFILKSIKKIKVKDIVVYSPLNAKHKDILEKFKCPLPCDSI